MNAFLRFLDNLFNSARKMSEALIPLLRPQPCNVKLSEMGREIFLGTNFVLRKTSKSHF